MDILKTAIDWAKGEAFSSKFFILFGAIFVLASIGFWQMGKTDLAKAYVWPTLVAGILLLTIGVGLVILYNSKINSFPEAFGVDEQAFVKAELAYTEKTLGDYENTVFKVIPIIMTVAAALIIFISQPLGRAICISTVAMMAIILLIDGTASARLKEYSKQLELANQELQKNKLE